VCEGSRLSRATKHGALLASIERLARRRMRKRRRASKGVDADRSGEHESGHGTTYAVLGEQGRKVQNRHVSVDGQRQAQAQSETRHHDDVEQVDGESEEGRSNGLGEWGGTVAMGQCWDGEMLCT